MQRGTLLGALAVLLWGSTIAFSRSLTEQLGTLTAAALIYTIAGLLGLLLIALRPGAAASLRRLPRLYLFGCGALFVSYILTFYLAIGLSATRAQVLVVGLINYLWPALSLVLSIPLLGRRAGPLLPAGVLLALLGTWLATTGGSIAANPAGQPAATGPLPAGSLLPYLLALVAAISWALYSNLSRRWAGGSDGDGVPLFLLASGLLLGALRLLYVETSSWSLQAGLELAYMAVFPALLAYAFWDYAVRKGEITLVAAFSYLTPLLSTIVSALVLNVWPGYSLWLGAALVIAGAVVCKISVHEPARA